MVFLRTLRLRPAAAISTEILRLWFTARDAQLAASTLAAPGTRATTSRDGGPGFNILLWSVPDGARMSSPNTWAMGGAPAPEAVAFQPAGGVPVVAGLVSRGGSVAGLRLEVHDLSGQLGAVSGDVAVRAPVAWGFGGQALAGVSVRDPRRVVVMGVERKLGARMGTVKMGQTVLGHLEEVKLLGFMPGAPPRHPGAVVSAGRDGYVRVTDAGSGRTLKRIQVGTRSSPSLMQVAPVGGRVVTVWGRDVVVWDVDTGRVQSYNLDAVRDTEGWPLAISPDARYLVCRNEDGFDVSDVETGQFRGDFAWPAAPIVAAAFDSTGTRLAVGDMEGLIQLFDVVTGDA
ncbi:hypothetical protein C8A05DRAFT_39194 [Staphylotrichum tortipilum]|uniref:WD40 repeat domain-containing protein n=1 Tax=Staphylotrichum tortipilum TaxID=2831512 RepID=A0AAN6RP38_9PEZI|nr:hypothetical protein C8A05DRAFT_39194 [Staphylotrichum longicolle]